MQDTKIFLVRHGETFAKTNENQLGLPFVCGSGSEICRITHLTDNGKKQMFQVGEKYKNLKFDCVVVSDLPRSVQSAEEFLKGANQEALIKKIISDARVTEINYGQDDGVSEEVVKEKKKNFFADKTKTAQEYDTMRGGETFLDAGKRMQQAVLDIAKKNINKNILIISHSGSIRAFTGNIVPGQDLKFGEVVEVDYDGEKLNIVTGQSPKIKNLDMQKRLVYILPEATEKTHMKYNVEFVTALAKEKGVEIYLIIERGQLPENFEIQTGVKYLKYTGNSYAIFRILKLNYYLLHAWFLGYKKVYIHYSFVAAFFASLYPFFTTYYWNCGLPWKYKRPFFQELYETSAYKLIDYFVTGTQNLATQYAKFYNFSLAKNIPIPNWIDLDKINDQVKEIDPEQIKKKYNLENSTKILFFNQRLARRKGIMHLPKILEYLKNNFKENFLCIVTNDGPDKEIFLDEIKKLNLENNILMLGKVPNTQVINIMTITDVYLLPSEEEGMSHSLMEAFATGTPAVAFSVGGTLEMFPENFTEYCVEENNLDLYCKKLLQILQNKEVAEKFAIAAKKYIEKYHKPIVVDLFINDIIDDIKYAK